MMAETDGAPCPACTEAKANRWSGAYRADCKECSARALSHSPEFFKSHKYEKLTPAYRHAIEVTFGENWKAGHERVKAWAQLREAQ